MGTERVTYATLAAGQTEEFSRKYDDAVEAVRASFGGGHAHWIDGVEVGGAPSSRTGAPSTRVS